MCGQRHLIMWLLMRQETRLLPSYVEPLFVETRSAQRGLTLVELMIVIAIAAILAAIGFPSMNDFIQNNRLVSQVNSLIVSLNDARSHAVTRARPVIVCGSANGVGCDGDWSSGWMSFVDVNANGVYDVSDPPEPDDDILLSVMNAVPAGVDISLTGAALIRFNAQGVLDGVGASTFTICDNRGDQSARGVLVFPTGRSSAAEDTDDNGVRNDVAENDINC